jgi:SsrA-binding protein
MPTIITNRKAYYNYQIIESYEAGIKLMGHEVKSIKEGKGNLQGSFIFIRNGNMWLKDFNLPLYSKSGVILNYNPKRNRKLLMHSDELKSLSGKVDRQGFTLIPLKIYDKGNLLKMEVGLARGKKQTDIKQDLIRKQEERAALKDLKILGT